MEGKLPVILEWLVEVHSSKYPSEYSSGSELYNYIYVLGKDGSPQMPTSERKACLLLKEGKVSIYRKLPFTIKLNYKTGNTTQPGFLGIDTGP